MLWLGRHFSLFHFELFSGPATRVYSKDTEKPREMRELFEQIPNFYLNYMNVSKHDI